MSTIRWRDQFGNRYEVHADTSTQHTDADALPNDRRGFTLHVHVGKRHCPNLTLTLKVAKSLAGVLAQGRDVL